LRRLCADEIAIGNDHNCVLPVPRHNLRPVVKGAVDHLAETSLGILKLPTVHFAQVRQPGGPILVSASQQNKGSLQGSASSASSPLQLDDVEEVKFCRN